MEVQHPTNFPHIMVVERFDGKSHRQWANLVIEYSEEPDLEAIYNMPIRDLAEHFHQITNGDSDDDESVDDEDECGAQLIDTWEEEAAEVKKAYKELLKQKNKLRNKNAPKF